VAHPLYIHTSGDETWVSIVNVETKVKSKQWMHTHSPNKSKKFKQTLSVGKLMATASSDRKGVLMVEFMQQETTIMSQMYYRTLKRRGMLISGVVLLHDNERPQTAAGTPALQEQ
jgi:hypothetical protein